MALSSDVLDALIAAGASAEMIVAAVKAEQQRDDVMAAERRARAAETKRKNRAELRNGEQVRSSPVKSRGLDETDANSKGLGSSPKESSPTPPKEITPSPSSLRSESPRTRKAWFDEIWAAYPKREGSNPKQPAEEKFYRLVKANGDPEALAAAILDGVRRYASAMAGSDPKFIAQAVTWLNQGRWNDEHSVPVNGHVNGARAGPKPARPMSMFDATIDLLAEIHDKHH